MESAELLIDSPMAQRGKRMMGALLETAPKGSVRTRDYIGQHRLLVMYGVGLKQRMVAREKHLQAGGHVVMWDLGYWDRDESMRLAIDSFHPTAEQLAMSPASGHRMALREDADPAGPIMLVGLGVKSGKMLGIEPMVWEREALRRIQQIYPGRKVWWRPKAQDDGDLPGTERRYGMSIEAALKGCSLVVCRHSNVAVDACIAGVPVQCAGGAALALYAFNSAPTRNERADFLLKLAFWQWKPSEAVQAWDWIKRVT